MRKIQMIQRTPAEKHFIASNVNFIELTIMDPAMFKPPTLRRSALVALFAVNITEPRFVIASSWISM